MGEVIGMGFNPMDYRPQAGKRVTVLMKDGSCLDCMACLVTLVGKNKSGISILYQRKPINETKAKAWRYTILTPQKRAEILNDFDYWSNFKRDDSWYWGC